MKIIADNKIPYLKGLLDPFCNIEYFPGKEINNKLIKDADALIIRTRTVCNKDLLDNTKVKFIATATIGYDHIDTRWCEQNGVVWTNAPGCNSGSVMQYIASVLVTLSRKEGFQFADRTLGVIGIGNVGKKVVKVGEALGMRVVLNDPPLVRDKKLCGFISLDGILREADIITLHTPLSYEGEDKTFHLFDDTVQNKIRKGSILINSSRGEVVDSKSVINQMNIGKFSNVVFDVWENEPKIDRFLLENSFISTPHIAGYSADGKANGTLMSVKAIDNFFRLGFNHNTVLDIPKPTQPLFEINCVKLSDQEIICRSIEHTYDVLTDSKRLKDNPDKFEYHRETYPIRREFGAYTIKLIQPSKAVTDSLKLLGFNIEVVN
jgi:erythronate-4-phosphate dehydrogenase